MAVGAGAEQSHKILKINGVPKLTLIIFCHTEKPPQLEETPKWRALKQVLDEIDGEIQQMVASGDLKNADECRVLVCAEDDHTCHQLQEVICVLGADANVNSRVCDK